MKNKFSTGFLIGSLATLGAVAATIVTFKKSYIDPVETKADEINENRRRAIRKSRAAHQA